MSLALCRQLKPNGSPCRAAALHNSAYCFFHDPELAKERQAARIRGGQERSRKAPVLPADTPDVPLTTEKELIEFLATTLNQVRRGQISPNHANSIGFVSGILFKVMRQDVERRVARIESVTSNSWLAPTAIMKPTLETEFEFANHTQRGEL